MLFCDRHGEQCYYGVDKGECWCCQFRKWVGNESTDSSWDVPKDDAWIVGTIYDTPEWREKIAARRALSAEDVGLGDWFGKP